MNDRMAAREEPLTFPWWSTKRRVCVFCGEGFDWTPKQESDPPPLYCTKLCKNAARRASRNLRKQMAPGRCPTPHKVHSFEDAEAAARFIRDNPSRTIGNRPYLCACGLFHIGRIERDDAVARGLTPCDACRQGGDSEHVCDIPGVCPCKAPGCAPSRMADTLADTGPPVE